MLAQGLFPAFGFYAGPAFRAPVLTQALLYGMSLLGDVALILLGYRWLAARRRWLAVLAYGLLLLALLPATRLVDQRLLTSGEFIFQHGYTIGWDIVYGEVLFVVPLLLYELLRLRLRVAPTVGARQERPLR